MSILLHLTVSIYPLLLINLLCKVVHKITRLLYSRKRLVSGKMVCNVAHSKELSVHSAACSGGLYYGHVSLGRLQHTKNNSQASAGAESTSLTENSAVSQRHYYALWCSTNPASVQYNEPWSVEYLIFFLGINKKQLSIFMNPYNFRHFRNFAESDYNDTSANEWPC